MTYRGTCHLALPDAYRAPFQTPLRPAQRSPPESAPSPNLLKMIAPGSVKTGQHYLPGVETARALALQSRFDSPHRTICRRNFCNMVSLSHFLTAPDETSCSERVVVNVATRDCLSPLCSNDCAISALLLLGCVKGYGRSKTERYPASHAVLISDQAGNRTASRSCSLLLAATLSALSQEALSQEAVSQQAVTFRSDRPQERVTAMLRNHLHQRGVLVGIDGGGIRLRSRHARSKPEQTSFQPPRRHRQPFDQHKKNHEDIPSECGELRQHKNLQFPYSEPRDLQLSSTLTNGLYPYHRFVTTSFLLHEDRVTAWFKRGRVCSRPGCGG